MGCLQTLTHASMTLSRTGRLEYGPMGEDLFAEMCMRKNGVTELEVFDITKDGCCEAKRPGNEKKNKKWKPDCATTNTAAIHPFKKPAEYEACMEAAKDVK